MENSSIEHTGPLGIDDFPTELKVTIKLKNAKPRDLTEISRMYTHGVNSIYMTNARNQLSDFYTTQNGFTEEAISNAQANARKAAAKAERSRMADAKKAAKKAATAQNNANSGNAAAATPDKTQSTKQQNQQQASAQPSNEGDGQQETPPPDSKETKQNDAAASVAYAEIGNVIQEAYNKCDEGADKDIDYDDGVLDPEITEKNNKLHLQGGYERAIELRQNIDEIA